MIRQPTTEDITYLYEDQHLLAVRKPSGLLTVPGKGPEKQDCMIARVVRQYPNARIIHRLDQSTSGIVLVAKGMEALRAFNLMFEKREVDKRYEAWVAGIMVEDNGTVDLPMVVDWPNRPKQKVCHEEGRRALTHYTVRERQPELNRTRVDLFPITGRSHQLRVHMLTLGHPIVGDDLYAPDEVRDAAPRMYLHATELKFVHPLTGEALTILSEPPF